MKSTEYFWLGFCAGMVSGAIAITFVVAFAPWLYNKKKWY